MFPKISCHMLHSTKSLNSLVSTNGKQARESKKWSFSKTIANHKKEKKKN